MAIAKLGAIRSRKDRPGTYEATYYVNGQRRRASAESREAVSLLVTDLIREAEKEPDYHGSWDPNITLAEYGRGWIDDQDHLEPKTLASYRYLLFEHVLGFRVEGKHLGNIRIRDIRRRHLKALIREKKSQGYAKDSVRLMRAVLSSLLTDAVDDEIIEMNPAQMLFRKEKGRKKQGPEQDITPMEESEFQAFVEAAKKEKIYGAFLITLGKAGLRPSEAIALTPDDVKLDKRVLRVEKVYASGRVRPYTKNGIKRNVDLSSELVDLLRSHIARMREGFFKRGEPMPEMLFPNAAGKYLDKDNASRAFHRICKKAKIGRFRLYDLRHSFASLLLANGAPITYVASQLGHRRPTTTLRYYARWLPKEGRSYVDSLDIGSSQQPTTEVVAKVM